MNKQQIMDLARQVGFEVHDRKQQARVGVDALLGIDSTDKLARFAELVAAPLLQRIAELTGAQLPTAEDIESQNWDRVDGAIAWHLVDRYAEDWAHTARLMHAWRDAAVAEALAAERKAIRARGQHG